MSFIQSIKRRIAYRLKTMLEPYIVEMVNQRIEEFAAEKPAEPVKPLVTREEFDQFCNNFDDEVTRVLSDNNPVDDINFEREVENVLENYDFRDAVDDRLDKYDFSGAITDELDNYDFDDKIKDGLKDALDDDDMVAEIVKAIDEYRARIAVEAEAAKSAITATA